MSLVHCRVGSLKTVSPGENVIFVAGSLSEIRSIIGNIKKKKKFSVFVDMHAPRMQYEGVRELYKRQKKERNLKPESISTKRAALAGVHCD